MPLDAASFLQHTSPEEKTTIYTRAADGSVQECEALLVAQTRTQKLFITIEKKRRYVTHTLVSGSGEEVEIDFVQDYEEIEALMEDAGLDGIHDGEQGILYHNLLFLLMNP